VLLVGLVGVVRAMMSVGEGGTCLAMGSLRWVMALDIPSSHP
jgi:hypothetical protein